MSLDKDQTLEILRHYADPLIDHEESEACGHCERQRAHRKAAEEELKKHNPSYYFFVKRSEEIWKESRHYKAWQEISKTIPEGLEKEKRIEMITQKMREIGLEP